MPYRDVRLVPLPRPRFPWLARWLYAYAWFRRWHGGHWEIQRCWCSGECAVPAAFKQWRWVPACTVVIPRDYFDGAITRCEDHG